MLMVGVDGLILRREIDGTFTRIGGVPHYTQSGGSASSFADALHGIVMNSDDYMFPLSPLGYPDTHFTRTSDGGRTWAQTTISTFEALDLVHLSATSVCASGYDIAGKGSIMRSDDGGASWSTIYTGTVATVPIRISSGSPDRAVAVGSSRAFVIANGTVTVVTTPGNFQDVAFASPMVVVGVAASGNNGRSADGGLTWTSLPSTTPRITQLDFATATTAFGVTSAGIVRSDDVGTTWTPVPSGAYTKLRNIDFADAEHGVAAGDRGQVLFTSDGGATWLRQDAPTARDLNDVTAFATGGAFVSGDEQILFEYSQQPVATLIESFDVDARPFAAQLRWTVHDDGSLATFVVLRRTGARDETVASVGRDARSFVDEGLTPGRRYEYQLLAQDHDGSTVLSAPIAVTIPTASLELLPNQPNPFNPTTRIAFVTPARQRVRLDVFDAAGHRVATLVDDVREPGIHSVEWKADGAASGVYFARLRAGKASVSRKMALLK